MEHMETREIIEALEKSATGTLERNEDCLPLTDLAAYVEGVLDRGEKAEAESHLADCDYCLGQVGAIARSLEEEQLATIPASFVQAAERLAGITRRPRWRATVGWAVAATVVLAIGLISSLPVSRDSMPESALPQVRYVDRQGLQPALLAPSEGSVIRPMEQVFRWSEVPGSLFYDVRLVSPDGDLLLRQRVDETRWLIPQDMTLKPGEEYYVRVDAYLSDAKYVSSEHVVFIVAGQE
jgi:hypothetical protein